MKIICALIVVVLACNRTPKPASLEPTDDGHARTVKYGISVASFNGTDLVECDDLVAAKTVYRDIDRAALHEAANKLWAAMKPPPKGTTSTRLDRSCGEQFSDRPPFGLCADIPMAEWLTATIAHYSFPNVFRSDWAMKECMSDKGRWNSLSRRSPEFIEAQMRFDQTTFEKRARKIMKASGLDPATAGLD